MSVSFVSNGKYIYADMPIVLHDLFQPMQAGLLVLT
jgi:hypothetical protein